MAYENNFITFVGNLTEDPDLRYTSAGVPVVNFRVASNRRWQSRDGQQQEETTFMGVSAWRDLADNAGQSLHKGDRVVVIGRVKVRSYENQQGQTVWVTEIEADEIAPSLRWAQATPVRAQRDGAAQSDAGSRYAPPPPSDEDVPF